MANYTSEDGALYECQNCGETWPEDRLEPVRHLTERVAPGERMPAGQCPDCGAVCHEIDDEGGKTVCTECAKEEDDAGD